MNISQYISQLLYSQNHVVIPNFGGFVCQDFRAEINEATQMFMPPSKRLSFQPGMADFDDSLVNAIAHGENISVKEAGLSLQKITAEWSEKLTAGEHVKLDGIGRLFKNNEGEFSFQADINANFDSASFGLSIFRFPELKGQTKSTVNVKGSLIETVKNTGFSKYWQVAAIFVGIVGLFYLGTQKADFNSSNFASFNPLVFSKTISVEPEVTSLDESGVEESAIEEEAVENDRYNKELSVKEDTPPLKSEKKILPPKVNIAKPYNIIVGAFGVKTNADNYVVKLKNDGYINAVSFLEKGLYKVSVNQFISKEDARKALVLLKQKTNKGAWIYRR